jgi:hypothetical protein
MIVKIGRFSVSRHVTNHRFSRQSGARDTQRYPDVID